MFHVEHLVNGTQGSTKYNNRSRVRNLPSGCSTWNTAASKPFLSRSRLGSIQSNPLRDVPRGTLRHHRQKSHRQCSALNARPWPRQARISKRSGCSRHRRFRRSTWNNLVFRGQPVCIRSAAAFRGNVNSTVEQCAAPPVDRNDLCSTWNNRVRFETDARFAHPAGAGGRDVPRGTFKTAELVSRIRALFQQAHSRPAHPVFERIAEPSRPSCHPSAWYGHECSTWNTRCGASANVVVN